MKRKGIFEAEHNKVNWRVKTTLKLGELSGIELHFKLVDRMAERNLTVRQLASITGLRLATISDIMNGNRSSVNFQHLAVLMMALKITNVSDLVEIHIPEYLQHSYEIASEEWKRTGEPPSDTMFFQNFESLAELNPEKMEQLLEHQEQEVINTTNKMKAVYEANKKGRH